MSLKILWFMYSSYFFEGERKERENCSHLILTTEIKVKILLVYFCCKKSLKESWCNFDVGYNLGPCNPLCSMERSDVGCNWSKQLDS